MKIEKVNDNQIRCTLTREDLADRQLKLSELAYGTEKAKSLFRDMMQQASYEFGFEAEDIPLMIEAIPLSADTIILIITKVEYPDELDTRFSKFSDSDVAGYDDFDSDDDSTYVSEGADNILGLFQKIQEQNNEASPDTENDSEFVPLDESIKKTTNANKTEASELPVQIPLEITKLFSFKNLDTITQLSHVLIGFYDDYNVIFKHPSMYTYYLLVRKGHHSPADFNKVCNILSEYGHQEKYTAAQEAYFNEHFEILIQNNALQVLAEL